MGHTLQLVIVAELLAVLIAVFIGVVASGILAVGFLFNALFS
jgi:ABC-type proline/glycine betaine transport system permease subunit